MSENTSTPNKDGFFLSSIGFYHEKCCDVSCSHRHSRATVAAIRNSIFPPELPVILTKGGKPSKRKPDGHKDPPGHWYCAQVVHYGLKPTFTKATAKKRLTEALEANNLKVPQDIIDIETQLRQQLNAEAIRPKQTAIRTKQTAHRDKGNIDHQEGKRKAEPLNGDAIPPKRTKLTARKLNQAHLEKKEEAGLVNAEPLLPKQTGTRTKQTARKGNTAHREIEEEAVPFNAEPFVPKQSGTRTKQTARKGNTAHREIEEEAVPFNAKPFVPKLPGTRTKQTARKGNTAHRENKEEADPFNAQHHRTKQTARKGNTAHRVDNDEAEPLDPPRYATKQTARSRKLDMLHRQAVPDWDSMDEDEDDEMDSSDLYDDILRASADRQNRLTTLVNDNKLKGKNGPSAMVDPTGSYEVSVPYVTAEWGHEDFSLQLAMNGSELWGSFDFGIWNGILKFKPLPKKKTLPTAPLQVACNIKCDEENAGMRFTGDDIGKITIFPEFKDDKSKTLLITGSLELMGDIKFAARWTSPIPAGAAASKMKTEWEYYNEDAYEEANRARWR